VPQSLTIEERVRQVLAGLGVPYELIPIDAAFADTASFCERYGFPLEHSVNTIIVGSKREPKQYGACLVLATTRLDVNHGVRKLIGASRVSFASADDTVALTARATHIRRCADHVTRLCDSGRWEPVVED
jgi:prolyl-tRNA editing enzyme YbaK/EbsC (Cys-tRNA(Pro) deacylase)